MPDDEHENDAAIQDGPRHGGPRHSSRRAFLSGSMRRAAYVAPIIWSVSARQTLADSLDGSAYGTGGTGNPSLPPPE